MTRYAVWIYLESFYTKKSGDLFGEGEFYFVCNKKRLPDVGEIKLGKEETFAPRPEPTLYFAIVDSKEKKLKVKIQVFEKDPGIDDKFIEQKLEIPLQNTEKKLKFTDKKGKCELNLLLKVQEAKEW